MSASITYVISGLHLGGAREGRKTWMVSTRGSGLRKSRGFD
jgi:hypothetical protein